MSESDEAKAQTSNQSANIGAAVPFTVWVLGMSSLLTDVSTELIHGLLPNYLVSVLKASYSQVGLIEGLSESLASMLKVFSGTISDHIGRRKEMLLLGYGLSALVKPLYIFAVSTNLVLAARLADRVGKGIRGAPRDALVADVTAPENRGKAYGIRQTLDTIGAVIGPALALAIMALSADNYRLAFTIALLPAFAVVALLFFGIREPQKKTKISQDKLFDLLSFKTAGSLGAEFFILMAVVFIFGMANSSDAFLILKARQVGIASALCPLTLVVMNLTYALSAYPAGVLSDKLGHARLLTVAFLIYALTYGGFALVREPWSFMACCLVYGLYLGFSQGVLSALVAQMVPAHLRGTAFGLVNLATGLSLLPASLLTGYLYETFGAAAAFGTCAVFALIAAIVLGMRLKHLSVVVS